MTDLRQAAQEALEAWNNPTGMKRLCVAMDALRTALAQQQAEPVFENLDYVAVVYSPSNAMLKSPLPIGTHLYKYPPQRKPLTDEMIKRMKEGEDAYTKRGAFANGWLSAEAAHNIKEQP